MTISPSPSSACDTFSSILSFARRAREDSCSDSVAKFVQRGNARSAVFLPVRVHEKLRAKERKHLDATKQQGPKEAGRKEKKIERKKANLVARVTR